jgi:hypothetical protein
MIVVFSTIKVNMIFTKTLAWIFKKNWGWIYHENIGKLGIKSLIIFLQFQVCKELACLGIVKEPARINGSGSVLQMILWFFFGFASSE